MRPGALHEPGHFLHRLLVDPGVLKDQNVRRKGRQRPFEIAVVAEGADKAQPFEALPGGDRPVWMAFSLPEHLEAGVIALRSGESTTEVVDAIVERGRAIEAVLFNCSLPEVTGPAIRELLASSDRAALEIEVGGYANALPTTRDDTYTANTVIFERRDEITADHYADVVQGWVDLGATIVGGCCDMYPEHIAALADRFGAGAVAERS